MFGWTSWRRYRARRAQEAWDREVRNLRGRAAIREAEGVVESAWIDGLDRAEQADPTMRHLLERERAVFTRATRRRAAEAEFDRRRLAAFSERTETDYGRRP